MLIWSFTEAEGIRRAIYDMLLLIFHLVLSAFRFEDVDVRKASRVLEWNLKRYPNGACVVCVIGDVCAYFLSPSPHIPLYPTLHQPTPHRHQTGVFFLFGAGHLAVPSTQKLWSTTHALMVVPGEDEDTIRAKSYKYQPFQSTNKLANDYWWVTTSCAWYVICDGFTLKVLHDLYFFEDEGVKEFHA